MLDQPTWNTTAVLILHFRMGYISFCYHLPSSSLQKMSSNRSWCCCFFHLDHHTSGFPFQFLFIFIYFIFFFCGNCNGSCGSTFTPGTRNGPGGPRNGPVGDRALIWCIDYGSKNWRLACTRKVPWWSLERVWCMTPPPVWTSGAVSVKCNQRTIWIGGSEEDPHREAKTLNGPASMDSG